MEVSGRPDPPDAPPTGGGGGEGEGGKRPKVKEAGWAFEPVWIIFPVQN